jgi:hypothetical protein
MLRKWFEKIIRFNDFLSNGNFREQQQNQAYRNNLHEFYSDLFICRRMVHAEQNYYFTLAISGRQHIEKSHSKLGSCVEFTSYEVSR